MVVNNQQQQLEKVRAEFIEAAGRFSTVPSLVNQRLMMVAADELHYHQLFTMPLSEA